MPNNGAVIITVKLDDSELKKSIDKLVIDIDNKLGIAAQHFEQNIGRMQSSLHSFAQNANTRVTEIKNAFQQLGTTYDQFARAMERAAAAASGLGRGGTGGGTGGSGGTGGGGGAGGTGAPQTIAELKQLISEQQKFIENLQIGTRLLQQEVDKLSQQKQLYKQITTDSAKLRQQAIGTQLKNINSIVPTNVAEAEQKLRRLQGLYASLERGMRRLGVTKFDLLPESMWNRIQASISRTEKQLKRLQDQAAKRMPTDMAGVMGMSEKTLDQIAFKMKAISELRQKTPIGSADISRLNAEYARLSKLQTEVLGKNAALVESSSALGRAFNYIRNRLAFTLTIGAFTGFVRQLYEIRGQYELLERSLGVLLNSFSKGSQIFSELNQMAIQSPFTLIELGTAAKQLTAYNFKANEVVDTTRRLADISSALGVPMERLVYNLGQIRAQTVLTARDARDFANAGLAIVPELARYYTELEGKVVSTADVFDRMKKKAVSYNDVMSVLYQMTDEGGKFFDFQAKQAGTLKVQLANLNLAWNNMLNDLGKSHQGLLSFPVKGLREAFLHWKDISNAITEVVAGFGAYKVAQMMITRTMGTTSAALIRGAQAEANANIVRLKRIQLTRQLTATEQSELAFSRILVKQKQAMSVADYENMLSKVKLSRAQAAQLIAFNKTNLVLRQAIVNIGLLTQAEAQNAAMTNGWTLVFKRLGISVGGFWNTFKSIAFTKATGWLAVLTIGLEAVQTWHEATEAVHEFNNELAQSAKESNDSIEKFLTDYRSTYESLYKWGGEGVDRKPVATQDIGTDEAKKAWEAIKEEIIKSSSAGREFASELELIANINQRVRAGFDYLNKIQAVHGALEEISEDTIRMQQDWSKWWNLWSAPDSLKENLEDFINTQELLFSRLGNNLNEIYDQYDKGQLERFDVAAVENYAGAISQLRENLRETADDMVKLFANKNFTPEQEREGFNKAVDEMVQKMNLSTEQSLQFRMQLEEAYSTARFKLYQKELGDNYQAAYNNWVNTFNVGQSLDTEFLKWLGRNHRSEVQTMFGNMTAEEIDHINWSNPKWAKWAQDNANEFAKQYNLSFTDLYQLVLNANRWSVRIPVFFDFVNDKKSIYQALVDADAAADAAQSKIDRLNRRLRKLTKGTQEYKDTNDELIAAQKELTKAESEGGESKKKQQAAQKAANAANKRANAAKRGQKQAEDAVAKALREELSVIKEMQSAYDRLRKSGLSTTESLQLASSSYNKTLKSINSILSKYGISPFSASDFVGDSNPHKLLNVLQNQLDTLVKSGKVKTSSLKDLEMEINKITVDAREYDMKKITDGLNNELGKIKEEYELAVELDANPELGDMFANAFGIDTSDFPKTVQEAVDRMQDATNKAIAEYTFGEGIDMDVDDFMHPFNILNDDIDEWSKSMGLSMSNDFKDSLKKMQHDARDLYEKDAKQTMQEWQKLLEKYAEYETKRSEIQKRAERERETARKKGASKEILDAINLKEQRDLAKLDFDEFQKSATWITATGDLSKLSNTALQMLINKLVEYKRQAKNLEPKEILKINKALRQLRKEQLKDNPFNALSIASQEAQERAEMFDEEIDEVSEKFNKLLNKRKQQGGFLSDEDQKLLEEYKAEFVRLIGLKVEASKTPFLEKVKQVGQYVKAFKTVADTFKQIADSTNDFDLKQTADAISDVIGNFEAAEQGAQTWGGWWGAIIGGVTDAIPKIMKWVSGNAQIDYDIQQSQLQVKKLTNYYKEFEHAAEKALGVEAYGLQKAMLYYKQLELEQLKEQLRLEKSRKSKYRDQSAIAELEGQIIDLKNEIHDSTESIVNDLLGITSKADFAENLVSSMIDAFKEGEDYMKVFEDSFEDMVDNMIMKAIVSRLVGDWINQIWDMVNARAMQSDRAKAAQEEVTRLQNLIEYYKSGQARIGRGKLSEEQIAQAVAGLEKQLQDAIAIYNEAITPTPEDIAEMRGFFDAGREDFKENFLAYMDAFGIKFGQSAGAADLSALQQGIQGITEDTAGALEAYMNGVSQQVYLHSDLLTQIRDILINFGGDVTIATNAQILLQLQQSFQVQMTIQTILQGWSNASGLAMRVELVS